MGGGSGRDDTRTTCGGYTNSSAAFQNVSSQESYVPCVPSKWGWLESILPLS
jgi:hypothetical protein